MTDDFEDVRRILRVADEHGIDRPGFAMAALRRIQDALATTAQIAATNGVEMIRAQGRAERAEAEADNARQAALNLAGHVVPCERCAGGCHDSRR